MASGPFAFYEGNRAQRRRRKAEDRAFAKIKTREFTMQPNKPRHPQHTVKPSDNITPEQREIFRASIQLIFEIFSGGGVLSDDKADSYVQRGLDLVDQFDATMENRS